MELEEAIELIGGEGKVIYCNGVMIGILSLSFVFGCSNSEEAKENTRAITLEFLINKYLLFSYIYVTF
ncbi:hypothetical protein [Rossellomorea sp. DUT-2]|uniref:hypothetical protein n=1 Tax=Rossellomorea sp. DUT-2 TaxID=3412021 RepID=UPI003D16466B